MEFLAFPLGLIALGILIWMLDDGPQKIFAERRRTAEANARAEEARLKRAKLERE